MTGGRITSEQQAAMQAGARAMLAVKQAIAAEGRAFARKWRRMNGPKFDRLYGPDPHSTQTFPDAPWPGEAGW